MDERRIAELNARIDGVYKLMEDLVRIVERVADEQLAEAEEIQNSFMEIVEREG